MKIDKVNSNSATFKGFFLDSKGAYNLATEFVGKPELEQKFMHNIVEPLLKTKKHSIMVNDRTVGILNEDGKGIMRIIQAGSDAEHTLGTVYDCETYSRLGLRSSSYVVPTHNFKDDACLLYDIETAKNIIFDREAIAEAKATETYSKVADENLREKFKRLSRTFECDI